MKEKNILEMKDYKLDAMVKVKGTKYDKKTKVLEDDIELMNEFRAVGCTLKEIAELFSISPYTVRYHTDKEFRENEIKKGYLKSITYSDDEKIRLAREKRIALKKQLLLDGKLSLG